MKILDLSAEDAHYTKTFTLESVQYLVELRWIDRMSSWYIDVSLVDGTSIARGRRVAPVGVLVWDLNSHDSASVSGGVLFATGKDRYAREDLGITGGVNVLYASRAEWDIAYPGTVPELVRITPA
tara:strand:- start:2761 stop:3135 length:375 start_codon:yes stop_codon:yes gene_type:complete